jgi:hypothetical protein
MVPWDGAGKSATGFLDAGTYFNPVLRASSLNNPLPTCDTTITCINVPSAPNGGYDKVKGNELNMHAYFGLAALHDFTFDPLIHLIVLMEQTLPE